MAKKPTYAEMERRVRELERRSEEFKDLELSMKENEKRLRRIFDQSPIGGTIVGLDGRFQGANPEFCRFIGYSEKELLSLTVSDISHPDHVDIDMQQIQKLLDGKADHYQTEKRYLRKDGKVVWGRVSVRIIKNKEGKPLYLLPLIEDISERKKAEEALLESEYNYRHLFDESRDAVMITSREGKILDANRAFYKLFGYTREEMSSDFNIRYAYADPRDRDRFQKVIEEKGHVENYDLKMLKKDRKEIDCVLTGSVRVAKNGEVLGYQGIIRDVTEQKKSEEALKESENRYRSLVESTGDSIYLVDRDCRYLFINEPHLARLGVSSEGVIGRKYHEFHSQEDSDEFRAKIKEVFKTGCSLQQEHKYQVGGLYVLRTLSPVRDSDGKTIAVTVFSKDITNLKRAEKKIKRISKETKSFAYSISHDLKGPVIGLHGFTSRLYNEYKDLFDEKGKKYCEQILKTTEQIGAFIQQLNNFISAKESRLNLEKVSLKKVFKAIKRDFSQQLKNRKIKWLMPENLPEITADRLSIIRTLRNLVDNALKYGGESLSEIHIECEATSDSHIISVTDNGVGVEAQEGSKDIFAPFTRRKTSDSVEGSGLGLSIVKEIVEKHGGDVWFEPCRERGVIFKISIPKSMK